MICDDILELENIMGGYMYTLGCGFWDQIPPMMSKDPRTSVQVSPTRIVEIGEQHVMKDGPDRMAKSFPDYDTFHTGGQIGASLVEVNGDRAWGCFPSFGFLIIGRVFGHPDPPFTVSAAFGMWSHEFVREDGKWKIFRFQAPTLFEQRSWVWDPVRTGDLAGQGKIKSMPFPPGIK